MSLRNALHSMASKPGIAALRPYPLFITDNRISVLSIGAVAMLYAKQILHPTLESEAIQSHDGPTTISWLSCHWLRFGCLQAGGRGWEAGKQRSPRQDVQLPD